MSKNLAPIDITQISTIKDLLALVEEVNMSGKPRILTRDSETLVMLMPVEKAVKRKKKLEKTEADFEAFRSAAGGWKDVDTDQLLENIYENRRRTNARPPIKL